MSTTTRLAVWQHHARAARQHGHSTRQHARYHRVTAGLRWHVIA